MSIQTDPESIEQIRERIRKMSNAELATRLRCQRFVRFLKKNLWPAESGVQSSVG